MISVVVPVYNVEKYIVACLEAIAGQNLRDFELILVDDGSEDGSISLAEQFLKDREIDWRILTKENGGLASARNAGLKVAKGEFVVFIDADDAISPEFLSSLLNAMQERDNFSFCAFQYVKQQLAPVDDSDEKILFDKESLLNAFLKRTINFVVPSMLFRKSFLVDNGLFFDEAIRFSEDQPFIWNVILHSECSVYLYRKMYGYYLRDNSIMTASTGEKIIESHQEFEREINRYFESYPQYESIRKKILPRWELGALYTSARVTDYADFEKIYNEMNGRTMLKRIAGIGEIKAYLLAVVCNLSAKLLYALSRRMDLNG